jgi:MraZ protein
MTIQTPPSNDPTPVPIFKGEHERGMDKKGRVTLPAPFREVLQGEKAVITKGIDKCLFVFPEKQFDELSEKIRSLGIGNPKARRARRLLFAGASDVKLDSMGRINIPPYLREYAGLSGSVSMVGNGTYIEIWDTGRWKLEEEAINENSAEAWEQLGI